MTSYIPKIIGIAGSALLLTDVVRQGSRNAKQRTNNDIATGISDVYIKHQTSTSASPLLDRLKTKYEKFRLDNKFLIGLNYAKNIVTSGIKTVAKYTVPLGLAAGAIFLPPPLSIASAGLLVLGGAAIYVKEVMGIGKR